MALIVDASVAVKWFSPEVLHEEALSLLLHQSPLHAPDIMSVEFANAMWSKATRGEIDESDALNAIATISGRGLRLHPSPPLAQRAFEIARTLKHPVYDCVYLALAERLDEPLVTADRRLASVARPLDARVRLLGEDV